MRAGTLARGIREDLVHTINSGLRLLSLACAVVAAAAVGITTSFYVAEVVARYGFRNPLNWANDVGSYMLCAAAFLSFPLITRHRRHVAVTVVFDLLPKSVRPKAGRILELVVALVLFTVAWFVLELCIKQYHQGVLTTQANQIPRWWLTAVISFSLLIGAINYLAPGEANADQIREI